MNTGIQRNREHRTNCSRLALYVLLRAAARLIYFLFELAAPANCEPVISHGCPE